MMIKSILLKPEEGDPHELLGDPESKAWDCGARPPRAHLWRDRWCGGVGVVNEQRALVLAWEGRPVLEGLERAWRIGQSVPRFNLINPWYWSSSERLDSLGDGFQLLGTIILLDADGREVKA